MRRTPDVPVVRLSPRPALPRKAFMTGGSPAGATACGHSYHRIKRIFAFIGSTPPARGRSTGRTRPALIGPPFSYMVVNGCASTLPLADDERDFPP